MPKEELTLGGLQTAQFAAVGQMWWAAWSRAVIESVAWSCCIPVMLCACRQLQFSVEYAPGREGEQVVRAYLRLSRMIEPAPLLSMSYRLVFGKADKGGHGDTQTLSLPPMLSPCKMSQGGPVQAG